MATMKEVAERAGVSTSTVSRVLSDSPGVGEGVRALVREVVRDSGYKRNRLARGLRRQETMVWGLLISDIQNTVFTGLVRGVEDVAQANGYSLILCNSDENIDKESRYIDVLVAEQISGLLITAEDANSAAIHDLVAEGTPVVAIDRRIDSVEVDTVLVDNHTGAKDAVEHLIDQGARRIAVLIGTERFTPHAERLAGYRAALKSRGIPFDERLVLRAATHNEGAHDALRATFTTPDMPDALFIANNQLTVIALPLLGEMGVQVPRDVLVACFDDLPLAKAVAGGLTVVEQPTYALGRRAAELLLDRIGNPDRKIREHLLSTRLVVRGSSIRPSGS